MSENKSADSDEHPLTEDGMLSEEGKQYKNTMFLMFGEFLFILLPLIVISIVELTKGKTIFAILESPEWSFGSSILFGLSTIKLVAGFSHTSPKIWQKPVLSISFIIVVLLVPSLIILSLILTVTPIPDKLIYCQVVMFFIGMIVFLSLGCAGEAMTEVPFRKIKPQIAVRNEQHLNTNGD